MTGEAAGEERLQRMMGLPKLAGWVFTLAGAAMIIGGGLLAVDDPAGLILMVFGVIFAGAGYLARRLFGMPEGKKAVFADVHTVATRQLFRPDGVRTQGYVIHVDANAGPEEVAATRKAWLREQWEKRPDWVAGSIIAEDQRSGGMLVLAAAVWCVFALAAVGAAVIWGDIAVFIAAGAVGMAAVLVVLALRMRWRQRKFGASHLMLQQCPAVLGSELGGTVECQVPLTADRRSPDFVVLLRCIHRWEQTDYRGPDDSRRTRRHRQVLWQQEGRSLARPAANGRHFEIPVRFTLPADRPATTLTGDSEGVRWELNISASLPGIDYHACFQLPVLAPETAAALEAAN